MGKLGVTYVTRPDSVVESEFAALAVCYRYILDCKTKKEAARPGDPDDGEESKNDPTAEPEYTR